ncbi:YchJ family metal-binding protein [Streptomyces sp. NPDC047081]|uniref:YchJ family protein n=1 Tax=Streptomyces sp. NPDC047081 TaxID=3154706 RepID=UPI0033DE0615
MSRRTSRSRRQHGSAPAHSPACPCGLAEPYERCCGRFHRGAAKAPTAEALMRSRYTAFVKRNEQYLLGTWHPSTRPATLDLDPGTRWTGLEILGTTDGTAFHGTGTVTFRASFRGGSLHERSRFERVEGAWVYVDGEFLDG